MQLGVNLDHVATLRQARYRCAKKVPPHAEPSLAAALHAAERAGAHGVTLHLREDRRHIQDQDVWMVKQEGRLPLNLEMSLAPEIVRIALKLKPEEVCLVPERREEVTTEGGLNVVRAEGRLKSVISQLRRKKIRVSLFVSPNLEQVRAAAASGAEMIELNTGAYSEARTASGRKHELSRLMKAGQLGHALGLRINAGHGLNYHNVGAVLAIPFLETLNIGHSIVCRALIAGLEDAIRDMLRLLRAS
ncbi:MAG: pyridoxine 5'-phosphate synthase [Verrucomicrobiae bacterium]|nr:pyridoxine 5'-phosphate synthase [Verrucomicrobiae bacterium]